MDRIYQDAKDKNVSAVCIYGDATYGYIDSAKEEKITTSQLVEAFRKRALINVDGVLYTPLSLEVNDGVATVTYATEAAEGTAPALTSIVSVADPTEE